MKSVVDSYSTGSDSESCDNCCSNGCEIPESWFNDGKYCDCPNCADEDDCSCTSSTACPDEDLIDESCKWNYYSGSW